MNNLAFIGNVSGRDISLMTIAYFALVIWATYTVVTKERGAKLLLWLLVIWFFPFLGAIVYLLLKKVF